MDKGFPHVTSDSQVVDDTTSLSHFEGTMIGDVVLSQDLPSWLAPSTILMHHLLRATGSPS